MIDFPDAPAPDQLFVAPSGVTYQWRLPPGGWLALDDTDDGVDSITAGTGITVTGTAADPIISLQDLNTTGTFGTASLIPRITLDDYGRVTGVVEVAAAGGGGFQPLDSDLTAIAALATTNFGRSFLE